MTSVSLRMGVLQELPVIPQILESVLVLTSWVPWVGYHLSSSDLKIPFSSGCSLYVNMG